MPKITVLPHPEYAPHGATFEASSKVTLCDMLLSKGINIEHACGKVGACTTCHVVVRDGFESLNSPDENEEDMLDQAWGLEAQSRLSCQAIIDNTALVVELPKYTINHAKEEG